MRGCAVYGLESWYRACYRTGMMGIYPHRTKLALLALAVSVAFPTLVELVVYRGGYLDALPVIKLLVHFGVPVLFAVLLLREPLRGAVLLPFGTVSATGFARTLKVSLMLGVATMLGIVGTYFVLSPYLDTTGIVASLSSHGITREIFPYVAAWIILVNPLMEEYFWRGYVLVRGYAFAQHTLWRPLVVWGTGSVFALHHTIIVLSWFVWWQWLLTITFLAFAGVVLNGLYVRSGSIVPSLVVHTAADTAIVIVGLIVFGYV